MYSCFIAIINSISEVQKGKQTQRVALLLHAKRIDSSGIVRPDLLSMKEFNVGLTSLHSTVTSSLQ